MVSTASSINSTSTDPSTQQREVFCAAVAYPQFSQVVVPPQRFIFKIIECPVEHYVVIEVQEVAQGRPKVAARQHEWWQARQAIREKWINPPTIEFLRAGQAVRIAQLLDRSLALRDRCRRLWQENEALLAVREAKITGQEAAVHPVPRQQGGTVVNRDYLQRGHGHQRVGERPTVTASAASSDGSGLAAALYDGLTESQSDCKAQ